MALPKKKTYRGVRALDGFPIVTFNSVRPDEVEIRMPTDTGVFDFKMDRTQADRLRYMLGRALDPASEPARYIWS
ncbi:MAG: hypothetical protein OXQ90_00220 [Gammaproteobacteria bacterium]|nr:hypothetical protein [Gammaproteobacteria bacterium]